MPGPQWTEWVEGCAYLAENVWDKRVPRDVLARFKPATRLPAPSAKEARSVKVRAGRICDAAHPAFGQCGLFAARKLAPGEHVCDYRGVVTLSEHEDKASDYTLAFVEEGALRLTLDAARAGNEGRFINDFRGVPASSATNGGRAGANVRFAARVDARGQTQMGVYVLPGGAGIAKGAELLLSYGKGYWLARGLLRTGGAEAEEAELEAAADALTIADEPDKQDEA